MSESDLWQGEFEYTEEVKAPETIELQSLSLSNENPPGILLEWIAPVSGAMESPVSFYTIKYQVSQEVCSESHPFFVAPEKEWSKPTTATVVQDIVPQSAGASERFVLPAGLIPSGACIYFAVQSTNSAFFQRTHF